MFLVAFYLNFLSLGMRVTSLIMEGCITYEMALDGLLDSEIDHKDLLLSILNKVRRLQCINVWSI